MTIKNIIVIPLFLDEWEAIMVALDWYHVSNTPEDKLETRYSELSQSIYDILKAKGYQ